MDFSCKSVQSNSPKRMFSRGPSSKGLWGSLACPSQEELKRLRRIGDLVKELDSLANGELKSFFDEILEALKNVDYSKKNFDDFVSRLFTLVEHSKPELYQRVVDEYEANKGQKEGFREYFIELFKAYAEREYNLRF